jgi:hypothetical protein
MVMQIRFGAHDGPTCPVCSGAQPNVQTEVDRSANKSGLPDLATPPFYLSTGWLIPIDILSGCCAAEDAGCDRMPQVGYGTLKSSKAYRAV